MNPMVRNILAVIAGGILGSVVNMAIISLSGIVIPFPEGADVSTIEKLTASIHLFEPKHYLMPFLAHALGTLVGAFIAAKLAASRNLLQAMIVGVFFLIGGIDMVRVLPSPMWFNVTDLAFAYLPMAYLGYKLTGKK